MKILLSLLLVGVLVACDEESDSSSSGDEETANESNYSLKISGINKQVYRGDKLDITAEILENDVLVKEGSIAENEITLVIKCGKHNIGEKQNKNSTAGKATFATVEISGKNFKGQCSATVSATIEGEDLSDDSDFKVSDRPLPPPNTSLPDAEILPPPPELTITDRIEVGQPITIGVPSGFEGKKVKIQPRLAPHEEGQENDGSAKPCPNYFLVHHNGNQLTEVLTNGVVITANNGKLEGLVLIKKNREPSNCKLTLATTDKNREHQPKTITGDNPNFRGNLQESNGKLSLTYSRTAPAVIFFNTDEEGNLWTKHSGEMSSPAVSTLNYGSSSNAALVKTSDGWSYVGN